ncbi:phage tail protein [Tellurirhabdus bombi]|uniref:phage tail protein n=1 Tax=Tellurirhabdus bombi TaxID=2907205 RepID=UPI001F2A6087|nr:phage tail protein [Tellurirhabdus bombi]
MAAAARTLEAVIGKEIVLAVDKAGNGTFIPVGCMDKVTMKTDKGMLEYSCRQKTGQRPSGKDAVTSLSISGITHFYGADNSDDYVSAAEIEEWCANGTVKSWRWGGIYAGDPQWTATMACGSFTLDAPNDENSTYSAELSSLEKRTRSTVA